MNSRRISMSQVVTSIQELSKKLVSLKINQGIQHVCLDSDTLMSSANKRLPEFASQGVQAVKKRRTAFKDVTNVEDKKSYIQSDEKSFFKKITKKIKGGRAKVGVLFGVEKPICSETSGSSESQNRTCDRKLQQRNGMAFGDEITSFYDSSRTKLGSPQISDLDVELVSPYNLGEENEQLCVALPMEEDPFCSHLHNEKSCNNTNTSDTVLVSLYGSDIFMYLVAREKMFKLDDYMARQENLTANMRAILIEWLIEVQVHYHLNQETLHLTVKILDHYLNHIQIAVDRLQLLGATALLISSKYDFRCLLRLSDIVHVCSKAYARDEVLSMEREILSVLGYDIGYPTSQYFLSYYAKCTLTSKKTLFLGQYILELSLTDYSFTQEMDSKLAAASMMLAIRMIDSMDWSKTLADCTGYEQDELIPLVARMNGLNYLSPFNHLKTIRSKYSSSAYLEVAFIVPLTDAVMESLENGYEP